MLDSRSVTAFWLRAVYAWDRIRFALFRLRHRQRLTCAGPVSPNLRLARLRVEPGARVVLGAGVATERQPGNHLWVQRDGILELDQETWLRTEYGPNHLTVYPGARIRIGARSLVNGAMIVEKSSVTIGEDARIAFGVRILDSDLHDLDAETPERSSPIRIGARVWIGANVIVLPGVTIGDDVVVGAGSVVTGDIPARVLAIGSPARPVRSVATREGCR